jgi:hypothetical protein
MKTFTKYFLLVLTIYPLFLLLNNFFILIINLVLNHHFNPMLYGYYCSLKKHNFEQDIPSSYFISSILFTFFQIITFLLIFFKKIKKYSVIFLILLILDIITLICYLLFDYFEFPLFNLFFANSFLFLLSGKLIEIPLILPISIILLKFYILKASKAIFQLKQTISFCFITFLSITIWYLIRVFYFKII